jgi:hypothetical protein
MHLLDCPSQSGRWEVPEISRFFGMVVTMYYDDHAPAHFHVRYGEHRAIIDIGTLGCTSGSLPPVAHGLVIRWAAQHREELLDNWERARNKVPLEPVEPLR